MQDRENAAKHSAASASDGAALFFKKAGEALKWAAAPDEKAMSEKQKDKRGLLKTIVDPRPMFSFFIGASTHRRNIAAIKDMYKRCGFGKYPWAERSEWANPPKSSISFAQAARQSGMDRKTCCAIHRRYALTAWFGAVVVISGLMFCAVSMVLGTLTIQRLCGGLSASVLAFSFFFRGSFMSMLFRDRNLDLRVWEWRSRPLEWIPPLDMPFRKRQRSRSAAMDNTDSANGSAG